MSSVEETDFSPKCENCDQVVEYVNDEGLCQTCEEEHAIAIYEARNDRDWQQVFVKCVQKHIKILQVINFSLVYMQVGIVKNVLKDFMKNVINFWVKIIEKK